MIVLGIDCGLDGGTCLGDGGEPFPEIMRVIGSGRREYDREGMRALLCGNSVAHAFIERTQPTPKIGVIPSFKLGVGFALWEGLLVGLRIPYEVVPAQTWQKEMLAGVSGSDTKARSIAKAQQLWPTVDWRATARCRNAHDGKTDAALICEWGRRQLVKRGVIK